VQKHVSEQLDMVAVFGGLAVGVEVAKAAATGLEAEAASCVPETVCSFTLTSQGAGTTWTA
jgi:hypothetical protein